jgi:hypothetical protein
MRTQAAQNFESSLSNDLGDLHAIGAWYGTGAQPELAVMSGSSGTTPLIGSTPSEYLQQLQQGAGVGVIPGQSPVTTSDVKALTDGADRYACGLVHYAADTYASHDGVICLWTLGAHGLGELVWFPPQPAGDALVTAGLHATATIAHATG